MRYSKDKTLNHVQSLAFPNCLKCLDLLVIREGLCNSSGLFNPDILVLDLDCVEACLASKERRLKVKSMDFAFAISGGEPTELFMVLVELRFNYKNLQNLNRVELLGKVDGSTIALGGSIPINEKKIFVFKDNLKEQAKSRLFRMNPQVPNNFIVMDVIELKETYFN